MATVNVTEKTFPTLMVVRDGVVLGMQAGSLPGEALDDVIRQVKALDMRQQGFFGAAMAGVTEMAYTGLVDTHTALDREFAIRTSSNGVSATAAAVR